ncbi:hypothetical protein BX600DRAFT_461094 [Xylariales sp. PMI_506]|nr:hypothetical protein BX600DRAFT_461094 [Xylariales sp. PMI_506]
MAPPRPGPRTISVGSCEPGTGWANPLRTRPCARPANQRRTKHPTTRSWLAT